MSMFRNNFAKNKKLKHKLICGAGGMGEKLNLPLYNFPTLECVDLLVLYQTFQKHIKGGCKNQKQPSKGVFKKRCSENMCSENRCSDNLQETPMPKCDFNKVGIRG